MSVRLLARLFRNGKFLLVRKYYGRDIHSHVLEHSNANRLTPRSLQKAGELAKELAFKNQSFLRFGQNARRLFVDNILNRVTNPVSSQLRAEATKKFRFGDSTPFFSLVGVCLASGAGVITKEDEIEGVCWEIREAVARYQSKLEDKFIDSDLIDNLQLKNLDIGAPIANGCSAVVYAASFKDERKAEPFEVPTTFERSSNPSIFGETSGAVPSIPNSSRFIHNFGGSLDNLHSFARSPQDSITSAAPITSEADQDHQKRVRFNDVAEMRSRLSSLSSLAGDFTEFKAREDVSTDSTSILKYPLALKMMFNYYIQSNAISILRAMHKETIPARRRQNIDASSWEKSLLEQSKILPPHPNVVLMFGVFCDQIPSLKQFGKYEHALPTRLNPEGLGRNMSMFLLMKRYDHTLGEFLQNPELEMRTKVVLFAQLLEGVAHLIKHGVAHRDLKSDNILIETSSDSLPVLVLSDFGSCIADKNLGLKIPYTSNEVDRGGNPALMAPEIKTKEPGTFLGRIAVLNYSKSDLWACGAIAYEIFGQVNPFYVQDLMNEHGESVKVPGLDSENYEESDLPDLGDEVPDIVKMLVENILQRNPDKRLEADVAANVLQLYLWAPSSWMKPQVNPSSNEILQWLLSLTTKVLCEGHEKLASQNYYNKGRRSYTEYLLISSFLTRVKLQRVKSALMWIQANV